ncbi:MAG: hypothetical protein HC902_04520 [Calothrix sp. SM1_5_4]|nr:hypothetical protein [Calothrix sp. SM1_5_4]
METINTVFGVVENRTKAEWTAALLEKRGFSRERIEILAPRESSSVDGAGVPLGDLSRSGW